MMNKQPATAVLGATGYTGQELVRLLRRHPAFDLRWATSESEAGERVGGTDLSFVPASAVPLDEADLVFVCLPHGEAGEWALRGRAAGARVIDLSPDLRLGEGGAVYGLPELWRDAIRDAGLVANPGCYPTGILLTLAPLLEAGLVDAGRAVIIDAASGVTGAGRAAKREMLFGEVAEDFRAYAVGNAHRHVPEIAAGLERVARGAAPDFVFTPHLLPVRRGILETMYVPLSGEVGSAAAIEVLREAYAGEPFIDVLASGLPSLRDVVGSNRVAMGIAPVERVRAPLLLCVAAFDNLVKGAAGQAIQNANLLFELPEPSGLAS